MTRTRAVLAATGLAGGAVLLAAQAPGAAAREIHIRPAEAGNEGDDRGAPAEGDRPLDVRTPPAEAASDRASLGRWVAAQLADVRPDVVLVDAFPGGILGELCELAALRGPVLHHTARLLRWPAYARRLDGALPRFDAVMAVEPLHAGHERALRPHAGVLEPLALPVPDYPRIAPPPGAPWLVVHTGPPREVRTLARLADERRGDAPPRVVCPVAVEDLPAGAERVHAVPARPLYAEAAHIVTGAGFNTVHELAPLRDRHTVVPFDRRLDDQHARARRL